MEFKQASSYDFKSFTIFAFTTLETIKITNKYSPNLKKYLCKRFKTLLFANKKLKANKLTKTFHFILNPLQKQIPQTFLTEHMSKQNIKKSNPNLPLLQKPLCLLTRLHPSPRHKHSAAIWVFAFLNPCFV
jgi:hypothetical protein